MLSCFKKVEDARRSLFYANKIPLQFNEAVFFVGSTGFFAEGGSAYGGEPEILYLDDPVTNTLNRI